MDPLPPIPTPFEQRWREFRIQVLPVLFFLGVIAALVFVWRNYIEPVNVIGEVEAIKWIRKLMRPFSPKSAGA